MVVDPRLAREPVIALRVPVLSEDGSAAGELIGALDLSAIEAAVGGVLNRPTTTAVITDATGRVVVDAGPRAFATLTPFDARAWAERGDSGAARALVASVPLDRLGWTIHAMNGAKITVAKY